MDREWEKQARKRNLIIFPIKHYIFTDLKVHPFPPCHTRL